MVACPRIVPLFVVVLLAVLGGAGCSRDPVYSQATPEETIRTARMMLEAGKAKQLDRLIYADSEEMRKLLRRTGSFFGHVQELAEAINAAFPQDVAKMRAELDAAAKEGRASGLLAQIAGQIGGQGGGGNGALANRFKRKQTQEQIEQQKQAFNNSVKALFADPYGWLKESEGRLSTEFINDNTVSLRWDGKQILPPIGMQMRLGEDGKWYFALPTGVPGVAQFMPRTKDEYQIWGSLVSVFDHAVTDLRDDIRAKRLTTLDQVSRRAGEKAFIPAAMVVFAYSKTIEARGKEAKDGK